MARVTTSAALGLGFLLGVLAVALFVPAGTLDFWQAWAFLAVFGTATTAITIDLAKRDPALLERRVHVGPLAEPRRLQQAIQAATSLAFLAAFVLAGLDRRAGWSRVPVVLVIAGDGLVALGLVAVLRVFRANTFTSAVIDVDREQQLVSTGPYAVVRHPMYAGALVLLVGAPLALGSWWAELAIPPLVGAIVARLLDEERVLAARLPGYIDYRSRVRYRLVPRLW